ncbi:MAG: hypothetical protein IKZ53_02985 [Selenomonadaceae bacterium]|nr:hypothetical protein [Selenomonadaceae bacterium]
MAKMANIAIDSEDLKEFNERSGINMTECINILMNSVKYGGKLEFDPFWSDANMKHLQKSIREFDESKCVTFTEEEWEKFVNAQEI